MPGPRINFFTEEVTFTFKEKQKTKNWLIQIAEKENFAIVELNYIFTTDEYLLKINQDFLNHDTYTDIITFDNSEKDGKITGEIYISIERIRENALTEKTTFDSEFRRVMAHGLLHLCGYKDKTANEVALMRNKEDETLQMFEMQLR